MLLAEIVKRLEEIAPPALAEEGDNVGLIAGDLKLEISAILLTIDLTADVLGEAQAGELIVAYHPPIYRPVKQMLAGHAVFEAVRKGCAIYSPHTALDNAEGGTNDVLADVLGLTDRRVMRGAVGTGRRYKVVVFVPANAVDKVSAAMFDAGAGHIDDYSSCSFRSAGEGTFFGGVGTNPAVGERGKLERVQEMRLETVTPGKRLADVLAAMRSSHPYEEPAFDVYALTEATGAGMGRIGTMEKAVRDVVLERIKRGLGVEHLLVTGPMHGAVSRGAVCAGSCGEAMLDAAIAGGAEIYLTGEMRHHDALKAAAAGITAVCALHSNSERGVLKVLKRKLEESKGMAPVRISRVDRDPFHIV